jgi:hypothetical protein
MKAWLFFFFFPDIRPGTEQEYMFKLQGPCCRDSSSG